MAEYTYPGVYIKEVPGGPGPITGVSTSNLGLIGFTEKGPVDEPILVTSYPEFATKFGSFTSKGLTPTMAFAFFQNGGQRCYVVRVAASDATDGLWNYAYSIPSGSPDDLGNTVEPSGMYSLQLSNPPVIPGTVSIEFTGATTNIFTDAAGDGVLSATGGTGAGGSGFVDYNTGEVTITLTNPADYAGGANDIEAVYDYAIFQFRMKWPGDSGNYYRVSIVPGASDYLVQAEARYTRFTVLVEEDTDAGATGVPSWVTIEQFTDLVFDDPGHKNYVATVINADFGGSDFIEVVEYGNEMNPTELAGTAVTAEDFSATMVHSDGSSAVTPDAYDGMWKGWTYELANPSFPTTLVASFKFAEGALYDSGTDDTSVAAAFLTDTTASWPVNGLVGMLLYNTTDGSRTIVTSNTATTAVGVLVGGTANLWNSGDAYEIRPALQIGTGATPTNAVAPVVSPGSAAKPTAIVPGSVVIDLIITTLGHVQIVDDGAGNLWDGAGGSAGNIDYTTGQIDDGSTNNQIDISGVTAWVAETIVAGSAIYMQVQYATAIDVVDDGDGNLALATTQAAGYPQKFGLDSGGTNEVDYDSGEFTITWAISGSPASGPGGATAQTADYYTNPDTSVVGQMTGGADGSALTSGDVVGASLAADQRGLWAFGKVDELMQLVASDFQTDTVVADALITYAELTKDKFVILTVPAGLTPQEAVNWKKFQLQKFTSYAALYYPHIKIIDPVTEVATDVPCGGHVAGVYARTDISKNVGKAPAGTEDGRLNWSVGLELDLTPTQVGTVYPEKINCLVQWPHTGRCVWGARSLDIAGGEWPYIQMRRLFMFVEKSVFNATHSHVFKNNGPPLWSAIRTQLTSFLLGLYQAGYFAGTSPDEAFFVICDRTNNPQNTVDQGLVFCDIGIAPNKPAEFIVFRFQQKALV